MKFCSLRCVLLRVFNHFYQIGNLPSNLVNSFNIVQSSIDVFGFLYFKIRSTTHLFLFYLTNYLEKEVKKHHHKSNLHNNLCYVASNLLIETLSTTSSHITVDSILINSKFLCLLNLVFCKFELLLD